MNEVLQVLLFVRGQLDCENFDVSETCSRNPLLLLVFLVPVIRQTMLVLGYAYCRHLLNNAARNEY